MKDLYKLFTLTMGLPTLSVCEADHDSNPVLSEPDTLVLNVSAFASNNVYDLKNSESLELTYTQPDYGIPMAAIYSVQISLEESFVDAHAKTDAETNYTTLGTTHSSTKMGVKILELALTLGDLWGVSSDGEFSTTPIPVYVRLKAELTNSGHSIAFPNVIELPKVLGYKAVSPLGLPSSIFINSSIAGSNWSNWVPSAAVNGMSKFFGLFYFGGTNMFKFGAKEGEYIGFNDPRLAIASDALTRSDDELDGQNVSVNVTGWYTVIMSVSIKGADYTFTLDAAPGEVHLVGNAVGDWTFGDKGKLQTPTTADVDFVSSVCTGGGELRISVKVPREGW